MTFSKGGIHDVVFFFFFFSLSLKAIPAMREQKRKKKKNPILQFQVNKFTAVIRAVQLFRLYLSHRPVYLCCGIVIRPS